MVLVAMGLAQPLYTFYLPESRLFQRQVAFCPS